MQCYIIASATYAQFPKAYVSAVVSVCERVSYSTHDKVYVCSPPLPFCESEPTRGDGCRADILPTLCSKPDRYGAGFGRGRSGYAA